MKLPVAIAMLILVLAANTEAQEADLTMEQRFENFASQMKTLADDIKTKTESAFGDIHQSDFAVKTRSWFTDHFERMKKQVEETFKLQ